MNNKIVIFGLLLLTLAHAAEASRRVRYHRTYYGFGAYDEDQEDYLRDKVRPRNPLFPNGIIRPVFDTPYPVLGTPTQAKAYIYDRSYDRAAAYNRGWKNGRFGISLNGVHK